ncbi:QcrA and Rieske domain-containing protein [Desulfobulbus oligotrophicus]|jgi:cytochrome b6-f complex iron-sulfur subunit|uniref:Ubiquinol-cytochrome c reductase iron-sulfur subunit n=1 Tax=Desulfobulbus oligotrophicus TaxID=1909699 RepID=A0A7T6APD5_9BACT|nr:ubiquinol-cytochrome c reductase iron-sulfur subunit [Desulfobulbus oligotrophicus]MDY0390822.1 ubiquinol-cytochrome c reductase iron-sulfur subunit [Desulfobulbus oligotrophicus]QQG64432.1 ubiquinol-cytochrome c reductase iron-sulfur subunit [Desulfobulbus oligotrophicus]
MHDSTVRPNKKTPQQQSRRTFLTRWLQWGTALAATVFLYPLLRFVGHRIPPKPRLVEVPTPLPLSGAHAGQDFFLFAGTDRLSAVSRVCTHLGCRLNFQEDKQIIECPCHQSRFTPDGMRISGPAQKNLPQYEVTVKEDGEGKVTAYVVHL